MLVSCKQSSGGAGKTLFGPVDLVTPQAGSAALVNVRQSESVRLVAILSRPREITSWAHFHLL